MFKFFTESDGAEESTASIAGMLPTVPLSGSAQMPYIDSDLDEDERVNNATADIDGLFLPQDSLDDNGVPIIKKSVPGPLSTAEEDGEENRWGGDDRANDPNASGKPGSNRPNPTKEDGESDKETEDVAEEGVKEIKDKVVEVAGSVAKNINTRALQVRRWELERKIKSLKTKIKNASSAINKAKFKSKLAELESQLAELDKSIKALTESAAYFEANSKSNDIDTEFPDDGEDVENNSNEEEEPDVNNTDGDSDSDGNKKKFDTPHTDDVVDKMKKKGKIEPDDTLSSKSEDDLKEKDKSIYDKSDIDAIDVADHQAKSTMKTADRLKGDLERRAKASDSDAMKTVYKTLIAKIDKKQEENMKKAVDKMDDIVDNAINVASNDLPDDLDQRQAEDNNAPEPQPEAPEAEPTPDKDLNDKDDTTTDQTDQNAGNTNPEEGQTINADGTTSQESTEYHFFNSIDALFTEAPDEVADEIEPIIDKLNDKGYKTKYSSPGYKTEFKHLKGDIDKDGLYNGKLYSSARIQFDGDYKFPEAPKGWNWKTVDKNDYLQVTGKHTNDPEDNDFASWKKDYLKSLSDWVDELPDRKNADSDASNDIPDAGPDPTPEPKEESVLDSNTMIDDIMHTILNESMLDVMDLDTYSSYIREDADDPDYPIDAPEDSDSPAMADNIEEPKVADLEVNGIDGLMRDLISSSVDSMTPEKIDSENKRIVASSVARIAQKACDGVNNFIATIQTSPRVKQVVLLEDKAGLAPYIANATFKCNDMTLDQKTYDVSIPCKQFQSVDGIILNDLINGYAENLASVVGNVISSQDADKGSLDNYAKELNTALAQRGKLKTLANEPVPYSAIIEWYVPTALAINDADPLYKISTSLQKLVDSASNSESVSGAYGVLLSEINRTIPTIYKAYNTLYSDRESIVKTIAGE